MDFYCPYQRQYMTEIQPITGALADKEIKGNKVTISASVTVGPKTDIFSHSDVGKHHHKQNFKGKYRERQ